MASGGGGGGGGTAPQPGGAAAWYPGPTPARECESCRSAPGIPFCRVEWSFLCSGCAAVIHCHNWVVAVTPNPNANPNPSSSSNPDPSCVVPLSSGEEEPLTGSGRRGGRRRRGAVEGRALHRAESVMRYREKRKSRTFEKTVRYETRRAYADLRPRVDGKFARREGPDLLEESGEPTPVVAAGEVMTGGDCDSARPNVGGEVQPVEEGQDGGVGGSPVT